MKLLLKIETSFPKLIQESSGFLPDAMDKAEIDVLLKNIYSLYIEDVPPFLGVLLYVSAKAKPCNPWEWERLIYYLNVTTNGADIAGFDMGRDDAEIAAELQLRVERQKDFARLKPNQIEAVRDWLITAQSWEIAPSLIREIKEAVRYWSNLAEAQ